MAALGWYSRDIAYDLVKATVVVVGGGKNNSNGGAMTPGGMEQRMFTYHAASFRIALFFWVFQLKNLYDTIVWNDGPGMMLTNSSVVFATMLACRYRILTQRDISFRSIYPLLPSSSSSSLQQQNSFFIMLPV